MVLMMVLPLLLITVLPKMMNDPETKREMEQMQQQMNVNNQVLETKIKHDLVYLDGRAIFRSLT